MTEETTNRIEHVDPKDLPDVIQRLAEDVGGTLTEGGRLPDGSGFALMSMPLPKHHWAIQQTEEYEPPPMVFRMGADEHAVVAVQREGAPVPDIMTKREFAEKIRVAGKYAYRASTMQGKEPDLDPDALLQNLVVAFLGYWTADGLSSDEWANPPDVRKAPSPTGGAGEQL